MPLFGPPNVEKMKAKKDVEGLIKALSYEKSIDIRKTATIVLGDIGDPRAVDPLVVLLKDADSSMRSSAAESLGKIGDTRSVEPLIAALQDKDSQVREAASEVLVKFGEPAVIQLIATLKNGKYYDVRERAAKALGIIGDVRAVEPLIDTLQDEDERICDFAAEALGLIGDARAVKPLCAALKRAQWKYHLQESILDALGKISDARAVNPLITALHHVGRKEPAFVSAAYIRALEKIGTIEAREALVGYEKKSPKLPARLPDTLPEHVYVASSVEEDPGPGGSEFQTALSDWNADRYEQAAEHYLKAIDLGLTSVYEAASRSNLGKIYLMRDDVISAVDQFLKGLYLSPLTDSAAYSCSIYLYLIYDELYMISDRDAVEKVAMAAVGRSKISARAADEVRAIVRRVYK